MHPWIPARKLSSTCPSAFEPGGALSQVAELDYYLNSMNFDSVFLFIAVGGGRRAGSGIRNLALHIATAYEFQLTIYISQPSAPRDVSTRSSSACCSTTLTEKKVTCTATQCLPCLMLFVCDCCPILSDLKSRILACQADPAQVVLDPLITTGSSAFSGFGVDSL